MTRLLRIESSLFGEHGQSTRLARAFTTAFLAASPASTLVVRDLVGTPMPHLDGATFAAFGTPADARSEAQRSLVALADTLVQELRDADLVVIGLPMYNFGVPSTLKAWIDHVMRANVTFSYTATWPKGLLEGKKCVIVGARGGSYAGTPMDMQLPYLTQVLSFIGLRDVEVVLAEGMAQTQKREASLVAADAKVAELAARLARG
jgi:FMN-dependent NADH-azoreductase